MTEALRAELIAGRKIHALFGMAIFPGTTYEEVKSSDGSTTNDMYTKGKQGFFGTMLYGGTSARWSTVWESRNRLLSGPSRTSAAASWAFRKWRKRVAESFCSMTQPAVLARKSSGKTRRLCRDDARVPPLLHSGESHL